MNIHLLGNINAINANIMIKNIQKYNSNIKM